MEVEKQKGGKNDSLWCQPHSPTKYLANVAVVFAILLHGNLPEMPIIFNQQNKIWKQPSVQHLFDYDIISYAKSHGY